MSAVVKHGIENNEELAHAGDERELGVLTVGTQPQIESSDGRIAANSRHRRHIQDAPDLCASTPDTTTAALFSTVAVKWCQTGQRGDLLAIKHSQFRQLREQSTQTSAETRAAAGLTPETFSRKIFLQLAFLRPSICRSRLWSRVETPRVADVHNLAPDCGKSPCKRMTFCNRLLHTKIASKTRVRPTPQKLQLLQFCAEGNL